MNNPKMKDAKGREITIFTHLAQFRSSDDGKLHWCAFNHRGQKLIGKAGQGRDAVLGKFAVLHPVYRPVQIFKGPMRHSEFAATICEYPDPNETERNQINADPTGQS